MQTNIVDLEKYELKKKVVDYFNIAHISDELSIFEFSDDYWEIVGGTIRFHPDKDELKITCDNYELCTPYDFSKSVYRGNTHTMIYMIYGGCVGVYKCLGIFSNDKEINQAG
jgi:hypothetical protein